MNVVFADTFYYLALLNPRDSAHQEALAISEQLTARLMTTQYVLTEVADAFAAPLERPKFLALLASLETDPDVSIFPASDELFKKGVELYRRRPDKDWPLTDCIGFVVMRENGIAEALTGDSHFKQAGFMPLFTSS